MRYVSALATTVMLAAALSGCTSDQSEPAGIGNVDMQVTLATPPSGPNEQIDAVEVTLSCEGIDPVLGVPRPPASAPEVFTINTSTSQGSEPYNTIGLFEKQGLPAGPCTFTFAAVSNTGNTECTGEVTVMVSTNETANGDVVLACIHTPRYGGVRSDGTFNQCAEYRQILVSPTTQAIGNLVDIATEVYDPDGDDVTVGVQAVGACSNVATIGSDTAASCGTVSGCEVVTNTVECTDVGLCEIIVAVTDDGFSSCTGLLPDGSNNNAARRTIAVDCTVASGCGNGEIEPGEDCDPPDGVFCDDNCQDIFVCPPEASDPCDQSNECTPQTCAPDGNNQPVCTDDPQTGGACDLGGGESGTCNAGECVACVNASDCDDENDCTDDACDAGSCVNTPDDTNTCSTGGFDGTCNAGVCEGLCTPDPCTDNGIECVTDFCDPANGSCNPQNDGINTGCDLGGGPDSGVCDGAGTCVECNIDAQCDTGAGETCNNNNACEAPPAPACLYAGDFESLDQASPAALGDDGWLGFGQVFETDGVTPFRNFGPFPAPNGGPGYSAIAVGQGGPDQGIQQLVVYSDYNNGVDQSAGRPTEALVFQERIIAATDVGTTITFSFDAKRGDINDPTVGRCIEGDPDASTNLPCNSTARAFVKTLDPNNFNETNFEQINTTELPTTWDRYTITLGPIVEGLVGSILQAGFSATAANFEPSGNFYDNVILGVEGCGGDNGGGIELRPLPEIYMTGKAINYSAFRAGGPSAGEIPDEADIRQDLGLLQTAGFNLVRLFGVDEVSGAEKILQLAAADFPEMRFQQGLFLGGLSASEAASCSNGFNDDQVDNAIRLANTYDNVVTVSVGNETSFFAPFMPLNCLEGYITETRNNVTQPVTADDDYTFYANFFGRSPDEVLRRIDFVSIHTYPFLNYTQWDWRQLGVTSGPLRAEAMMDASLAKAQDNYQVVYDYRYRNASGVTVTVGESLPIVIGETGWKWRQTNSGQEIETYAANPVNAKWYYDLMRSWERSPNGPRTNFIFAAFDEAWKQEFNDDGWGFWDEDRMPNYVLCDTPVPGAPPCNDPLYDGAGFFTP